jgi:magnesium-transporting ATPase (P-type)
VLLSGKFLHMDPSGLLIGDIIKITAGAHLPADVRLLQVRRCCCC